MKVRIYIFITIFFISSKLIAQKHLNFWSRISIAQPITTKCKVEVEFQHRSQNNYAAQKKDIFEANLLSSIRTWIYYQQNENIGFALSPIAYYLHNPIIVSQTDLYKNQTKEIRFSAAVELKQQLVKKLWIIDRTCLEYRDFQHTHDDFVRLRNRVGLRYDLNSTLNFTVFDEIFLNGIGAPPSNFFDHNRLAFLLNYKPNKNIRLEAGYIGINRLPRSSIELLHESNFLLQVYFTMPHKTIHHHSKVQHHS